MNIKHWIAAAAWSAASCGVSGQTAATQPASAPALQKAQPAPPAPPGGALPQTLRPLPAMPHEARPDAWPQPDYVREAMLLTPLRPSDDAQALNLKWTGTKPPSHVVLPTQSQAFGFTHALRALVAARLDVEVAARGFTASRQTDVVGSTGPFVRRFTDEAIAGFARDQPGAELVMLYVGHDGITNAFLTLVVKGTDGKSRKAHRTVQLPPGVRSALDAMTAALPALLDDVGLKAKNTTNAERDAASKCPASTWQLEALALDAASALRACHALAVGTLLPSFESNPSFANGDTPAKLAWLAAAWAEASWRRQDNGTHRAIQDLAWAQLRLEDGSRIPLAHVAVDDPVVRPVAQLLSAREQFKTRPVASVREAVQASLASAANNMPPLARAAFVERGMQWEPFREVDLCAVERHVPGIMVRTQCQIQGTPGPAGSASDLTRSLYLEWRLASYDKAIAYLGATQGQRDALARLISGLPSDVAEHPFIRRTRYMMDLAPMQGSFEQQLEHMHARVRDFVQSTVDSQRLGSAMQGHSVSGHGRPGDRRIWQDPRMVALVDAERRLLSVLEFDRFESWLLSPRARRAGDGAVFLDPGTMSLFMQSAVPLSVQQPSAPAAAAPPAPVSATAFLPSFLPPPPTAEQLRRMIADKPGDMGSRIAVAMSMLKEGQPLAQAAAVIDEQPINRRHDEQVGESHAWAGAAHAFYFAGNIERARRYYLRVSQIGTGSDSDLLSQVRLRQIDGDLGGAMRATEARVQRYGSDFARRDLAAMQFMKAQPELGWAVLLPRLPSAQTFQLWQGAFVGHRMAGMNVAEVDAWQKRPEWAQVQVSGRDAPMYLHLHAVTDRVPSESDIAALRPAGWPGPYSPWSASATLVRMAMLDQFPSAAFDGVRKSLVSQRNPLNNFMVPLYAWAAWHADGATDPDLARLRDTALTEDDFDRLLAKAMLLGLDRKHEDALRFLHAARWQMSELGLGHDNVERTLPSPYQYALSAYLLWQKSGREVYRKELLDFARAYQKVFPFLAWTYSLEALTVDKPEARAKAVCRARHLDAGSYFLQRVPAAASGRPGRCEGALWPAPAPQRAASHASLR